MQDYQEWLEDVEDCIRIIQKIWDITQQFSNGSQLAEDERTWESVLWNISRLVTYAYVWIDDRKTHPEVVEDFPNVEWEAMIKMRHRIAHHARKKMDPEVIWGVVDVHLPILLEAMQQLRNQIRQELSRDH